MTLEVAYQVKSTKPYFIKGFILIVLTLASAMFPRLLTALRFPSVVNFLHFVLIVVLIGWVLSQTLNKVTKDILIGITGLFTCTLLSAIVNKAGVINIILSFLLQGEPFLLLVAIAGLRMSQTSIKQCEWWIILFAWIHCAFAYFQYFVLGLDGDSVKGVFLNQGAGHHVGGAISLTTAVYFFIADKNRSLPVRFIVAVIFTVQSFMCDAKQVVVAFIAALVILLFTKLQSVIKLFQYLAIALLFILLLYVASQTIFPGLTYWSYENIQKGIEAKFAVFSIIVSYYTSSWNWLFGLGPGHTIGRLGSLIPDYITILRPLGATYSEVSNAVWQIQEANYFTNSVTGSSMFALRFSWAGIWGDLGIVGLGVYVYLWFLVWQKLCPDDMSKFLLITIFVEGIIFSWMEEPAYMLFVISLVGVNWQKHQQNIKKNRYQKMQLI